MQARLKAEVEKLDAPQSRTCSLMVDEMRIKPNLQYNKQKDCFVGQVDMGIVNKSGNDVVLANSMLCFVINGLCTSYRIPVSYFFLQKVSMAPSCRRCLRMYWEKLKKLGSK